jgi:hypothetical protein
MRLRKCAIDDLDMLLRDVWKGADRVQGKPPA